MGLVSSHDNPGMIPAAWCVVTGWDRERDVIVTCWMSPPQGHSSSAAGLIVDSGNPDKTNCPDETVVAAVNREKMVPVPLKPAEMAQFHANLLQF